MKEERKFLSNDGKTLIRYSIWHPQNDPKGIIQLTHGMTEYRKNFSEYAEFLCNNGFLVIGHDQLGHGHSISNIEELGHMPDKDSVNILIEDMHTLMGIAKSKYNDLPYFLQGHSFGSFLSRIYAGTYGNGLSGLILTGTGNTPIKKLKAILKMVRAIRITTRKATYRSKLVLLTVFGPYSARIEHPKNMREWFSRDEHSVEEYINDPLNNFTYTLNGFATVFNSLIKMQKEDILENTPKNLPILMLSGSDDPVSHYTEQVLQTEELYKSHNVKDITVKIYEGARHNVLSEINKDEVMNDCLKWIKEKL